jgi:bifunctional enzyme CysN/CysC
MLWYADGSLLHLLETIYVGADGNLQDLRFPVQWVNRPDAGFRGFSGTVVSGTLRVGDEVTVLPSRKRSRVERIVTRDGDQGEAPPSSAITITLADEIDVARGDMIVRPGNQPHVSRTAEAMLVWMSEQPLTPGKQYWFKHTTRRTSGEIQAVRYAIDVNTLHRGPAASLKLNEIGRCGIALHDPVMFDSYRQNRETGSFIVVDRITHETVAAGMFLNQQDESAAGEHWDDQPASLRLQAAVSLISDAERKQRYAQQPVTILISGLSGSGKTTLALELERRLFDYGRIAVVLDGQNMRFGISRDLGFSAEERSENLRRAGEIARTINDAGLICLAAFVAPHDDVRRRLRRLVGSDRFLHVHLSTPIHLCRQRDTTGRYAAADEGEITSFPGVTFPYEPPTDADLNISAHDHFPGEAANAVLELLATKFDSPSNSRG